MARKLVGQEGTIAFSFGTVNAGTITWATDVPLMATVKNWDVSGSVRDADTSALGDTIDTAQPLRGTKTITFDSMVPDAGPLFLDKEGAYIRITFKPKNVVAVTAVVYIGFVSSYKYTVPDGVQTENVTVKVGLNF